MKIRADEKRVLRGFAIAYHFVYRTFDEAGKMTGGERGTISLGPRMIQADAMPPELADSIDSFLLGHIETIDL